MKRPPDEKLQNTMPTKSIKKNYIYNVSYQMLLLLTPLVLTPYISRILGPDGVGTVSYAESIVSYFALFAAMGITTYGQREISYVRDDPDARSMVFWNTKLLEICSTAAAFLAYGCFVWTQGELAPVYLALSLNLAAVLADVSWFFQGMEEFSKTVARNAAVKCLFVAYTFLFVKDKEDLLIYVLGLGLFTVLGNVSLWLYLPRYIKKVPLGDLRPFRDLKVVWSLFVPTIAIQIYTVLDKTMIGLITGSSFENGYYEQAIKISKTMLAVVTALGTVMVPRIGYHFGKKDTEEIQRLIYRGYRFVWFLGIPLCFGIMMTAGNFVPWFLGTGFEKVVLLLQILPFLILAIGINNVTGVQYLIPTKRQNLFTLTVVVGACTNFSLNMIWIRSFQSVGAAAASVTAETVIAVLQLILMRRELSFWRVIKEGVPYYIAGGCMTLVLLFMGKKLSPSPVHTLFLVISGAIVYFGILVLERDSFLLSNIKRLLKRLQK